MRNKFKLKLIAICISGFLFSCSDKKEDTFTILNNKISKDNLKSSVISSYLPNTKSAQKVKLAYMKEGKYYTLKNIGYNNDQVGATGNWNGADVLTEGQISSGSKWWRYNRTSNGYFLLYCDNDGAFDKKRVMEVFGASSSAENVSLWTHNGGYNQEWKMIGLGNDRYFTGVIVNRHSGMMLRAKPDTTNDEHLPITSLWVGTKYDSRIHFYGSPLLPDTYVWSLNLAN